MRKRNVLVALLLAGAALPAQAASLFVFGDSLVDSGNAQRAVAFNNLFRPPNAQQADPAPATAGYFDGRFSNGYNYADYLSDDLFGTVPGVVDRPATPHGVRTPNPADPAGPTIPAPPPYYVGGDNFSVGGAQAREITGDASPSFTEQLDFFEDSGFTIDADDLVLVTFGGNDIQAELRARATAAALGQAYDATTRPALLYDQTVAALTAGIDRLLGYGARNIVVTGQANVGAIPRITQTNLAPFSAYGTQLSIGLNDAFRTAVGDIRTGAGGNGVVFFDLFNFQRTLLANPDPSFSNLTQTCQSGGAAAVAGGCQGYLYFDPIHPVTEAHRAIATGIQARIAQAVPEPATWATMMLGFGLVGMGLRRRRRTAAA